MNKWDSQECESIARWVDNLAHSIAKDETPNNFSLAYIWQMHRLAKFSSVSFSQIHWCPGSRSSATKPECWVNNVFYKNKSVLNSLAWHSINWKPREVDILTQSHPSILLVLYIPIAAMRLGLYLKNLQSNSVISVKNVPSILVLVSLLSALTLM